MILEPPDSRINCDHHRVPDESIAKYHCKHGLARSRTMDNDAQSTVLQSQNRKLASSSYVVQEK
jgi:hypothetical protein